MTNVHGWLSVVPSALAIVLALTTRRVLPSLATGVLCAVFLLHLDAPYQAPARAVNQLVETATDPGNMRLILFALLVGALLRIIKDAGGFEAMAQLLERRRGAYGAGTAYGLTWLFGGAMFLETWSNVLVNGTTVGPLYDRLRISRERLAYFIHTIGINIVALVPINSWAAFYMALLSSQQVDSPFAFLLRSLPYMLYCWISLLLVAFVMLTGLTIGPMRHVETHARPHWRIRVEHHAGNGPRPSSSRARYAIVPLIVLVATLLLSLWVTGDGDIVKGDGSASILNAAFVSIACAGLLLLAGRVCSFAELEKKIISGMGEFLDMTVLLVLALMLGTLNRELGTGQFMTQLVQESMPLFMVPALVFVTGAAMSFATGTSYGTFSIMVPLALPLAAGTGLSPELLFAACIAGGVFGDNCSPISDTTIVTGLSANIPAIDHARTQLPFALIAAALSAGGYLVLGAL